MPSENLYHILGLHQERTELITLNIIKKAYHQLARRYHPDINPNGQEEMQRINMAYSILSDEQKRRRYDNRLPFLDHDLPQFEEHSVEKFKAQIQVEYENVKKMKWKAVVLLAIIPACILLVSAGLLFGISAFIYFQISEFISICKGGTPFKRNNQNQTHLTNIYFGRAQRSTFNRCSFIIKCLIRTLIFILLSPVILMVSLGIIIYQNADIIADASRRLTVIEVYKLLVVALEIWEIVRNKNAHARGSATTTPSQDGTQRALVPLQLQEPRHYHTLYSMLRSGDNTQPSPDILHPSTFS